MRVIDVNTGAELHVGTVFSNVNGTFTVTHIVGGLFNGLLYMQRRGEEVQVMHRLKIRYLHPSFLLQRVGFLNS